MLELGEWLKANLHRPRQPGVWDCCAMPGDWTVASGLPDPMAPWRGAYSSETEAAEFIDDAGGLLALFVEGFAQAGIPLRSGDPKPGDVAVLRIGELEAGSIYVGSRWAFIAERGIGFASMEPSAISAVWAVGHG